MTCPRCDTSNPDAAVFCGRCGEELAPGGGKRRSHFAAAPDEPVAAFAVVSTIMPRGAVAERTYQFALAAALAVPLIGVLAGSLPFAIATAALAIPVVYVVYIYDVNVWEDQPVPVVVFAVLLSAALAFVWTLVWDGGLGPDVRPGTRMAPGFDLGDALVVGLLGPAVMILLAQIGPLVLASRPRFDDLIDGLTFGVASGVAAAALETLVLNRDVLFDAPLRSGSVSVGTWVSLVVVSGLLKPIIYGTAVGIAASEFSGLGAGYDGFTARYWRGLAEAVAAAVAFHVGLYVIGFVEGNLAVLLSLLWSLLVAAVLTIRMRVALHVGLTEAALEASARLAAPEAGGAQSPGGFCSRCEMPLLPGAAFCVACGQATRATPKAVSH